ncbi:unnamed protein product, partial [Rotaria sordida]
MIYEVQIDERIGYSGFGWTDRWLNEYDETLNNTQTALSLRDEVRSDICQEK